MSMTQFHSCPACLTLASRRLSKGVYSADARRFVRDGTNGFVVVKGNQVSFSGAAGCLTHVDLEGFIAALERAGMQSAQPYRTAVLKAVHLIAQQRCPHCVCEDEPSSETDLEPVEESSIDWDWTFEGLEIPTTPAFPRFRSSRVGTGDRDIEMVKLSVINLVNQTLATHGDLPSHDGYRSVALATLDAVFSANAQYSGVINVLDRTKPYLIKWFGKNEDGQGEFEHIGAHSLALIYDNFEKKTDSDVSEYLAENLYRNRARIGGRLKAAVVRQVALRLLTVDQRLEHVGFTSPLNLIEDFEVIWNSPSAVEYGEWLMTDLCAIPGIGLATSRYLLLLLGGPYVKPDRMTMRFVQRVINNGHVMEADTIRILETAIQRAKDEEGWSYSTPRIDHLIWQVESGRLHLPQPPRRIDALDSEINFEF